ncbi:uncharacterized protein LOC129609428 isoform X3 [Condylostylus longicornis]|uniref:uncharacterized protein LOC129609428 isoform X3 n=1 Tax=Condylostylus longicornis TaxID=2530218 RepID=UPI00244DC97E|nr:uncharacterized protein LOC129609428 isoform X3 [Condylostylus longicornis]
MKSTFVIFILINLFLLTFTKSIAEEDDNAKYCKVKEHRNVKVKAGEHLVLPEKCQIIKCDEQGEKYTIEKSCDTCPEKFSLKIYLNECCVNENCTTVPKSYNFMRMHLSRSDFKKDI